MKPIAEVVLEIDSALTALKVDHAFGGALALAYYSEPRGTVDIDLNVATPFESRSSLLHELTKLGWTVTAEDQDAIPSEGSRLHQEGETVVVDLFFAFDDYHTEVLNNAVLKPFVVRGDRTELSFLAPEDLAVFKISFNRPKDWVDLQAMVDAGTSIDVEYVERQLIKLKGATMYPTMARFRALLAQASGT